MCYYVFENDQLYNHRSQIFLCQTYEEGRDCFNTLRQQFKDEVNAVMDVMWEDEFAPGYFVVSDGEEQYELVLSRSLE